MSKYVAPENTNSTLLNYPFWGWRWNVLNFFILLALLRLTNFNFYLSHLCGLEVEINNRGGNAFNFINYFGIGGLAVLLIGKIRSFRTLWVSGWPVLMLMIIYLINGILAPYVNISWVLYQVLFLTIALALHYITYESASRYQVRFIIGTRVFFWLGILFVLVMTTIILSQVSLGAYFGEFNDSFVQSLDDVGIMKQRYGYFLGFLLAYALYVLRSGTAKWMVLLVLLFAGIGIRSFLIGCLGAAAIFTIRTPRGIMLGFGVLAILVYLLMVGYFSSLIYDTRFYSYLNAADIVVKYPFGVGLGGYPAYTEEFSRELLGSFYHVEAILDYVPTAPESDLVHLFGSLGLVLGGLHLLITGRLVWYTYTLQALMEPWHKCILFYFTFMTFFGISEDSIFSINYWIFFGVASGIISHLLWKRQEKIIHPCRV